jgi:hypothetical protein
VEPEDRPEAFDQHDVLMPGDPLDVEEQLELLEFRRQPVLLRRARVDRGLVRPASRIPDELTAGIRQRNADEAREVAAVGKAETKGLDRRRREAALGRVRMQRVERQAIRALYCHSPQIARLRSQEPRQAPLKERG